MDGFEGVEEDFQLNIEVSRLNEDGSGVRGEGGPKTVN